MISKAEARSNALQWRRSKTLELKARGLNQSEIARELQVSEASISSDMQYLREQAQEAMKEYRRCWYEGHTKCEYDICR